MMPMPTNLSHDPTLSDVITESLHEDLDVELEMMDDGLALVIDGTVVTTGIPTESFEYPLPRLHLDYDAAELADEMIQKKKQRRYRRRMEELATETHLEAHGGDLPH